MKKVTVIVTSYNSEKHIQKTLDSILVQEEKNELFELELIVVDDCSTDATIDILKNIDLTLLSTEVNSGGPNTGRNIGLKKSTGDYIFITDHDDIWKKDRIKLLLPLLEKAAIVTCGYTLIDKNKGKTIERIKRNENGINFISYGKNETFLTKLTKSYSGQNTYMGSIAFGKELKDILFEEKHGAIDFDWVLRLFHNNESIEICESLYDRFVDGENLSLDETYRVNDHQFSLEFIEDYKDSFPNEVKLSRSRIHGTLARYYYVKGNMKKARKYFLKSGFNWKNVLYYLTSFAGSKFVIRKFNVFG